jgi:hypothetical protein
MKLKNKIHESKAYLGVVVIVVLLLCFVIQVAYAGTTVETSKLNFVGSTTAKARQQSFQAPESNNWHCTIKSYTSPATTINVIGWTWWGCSHYLNGILVWSQTKPGYETTANTVNDSIVTSFSSSSGRSHVVQGTHDFNHPGANPSPWRPYLTNTYP